MLAQLNVVYDVFIPMLAGIIIPFITKVVSAKTNSHPQLETFLNLALSAAAGAITTVQFDDNWKKYLLAVAVAWIATMRSDYTELPKMLYGVQDQQREGGKHEKGLADSGPTD